MSREEGGERREGRGGRREGRVGGREGRGGRREGRVGRREGRVGRREGRVGKREGRGGRRGALPPVCWSPGCRHHCIAHTAQSESLNTSTWRETGEEYINRDSG